MTKLTCQWQSIVLLFLYFILNNTTVFGQAVIQPTRSADEQKVQFFINNNFLTLGQSFTASQTGNIYSISMTMDKSLPPERFNQQVDFWLGLNPKSGRILESAPRQSITLLNHVVDGVLTFTLDKPFPVVKGKVYRMQFGYTSSTHYSSYLFSGFLGNPYPNGEVYFHNGMPQIARDLDFSLAIK